MKQTVQLPISSVVFNKEKHEYTKGKKVLNGVTPIVAWLFPETYAAIPQSILEAAAQYGSMIHAACQMSDVVGIAEHESVKAYQTLKEQHGLTTIANEYLVTDGKAIASSIDVVCSEEGVEGDALIDIKTTSRVLHNHLAAQLSIYAFLYEKQTGRKVGNLYCVWLPKERYGKPAILPVKRIPDDVCKSIINLYLAGQPNDIARKELEALGITESALQVQGEEIPVQYQDAADEIVRIEMEMASLQEREKMMKEGLLQLMREHGVKKWTSDKLTLTYVAETTRKSVDSKKLQSQFPDVYAECLKESKVSDSIKIKVN